MPDISMCGGDGCPIKESCHRFTAEVNPFRQSFFAAPPGDWWEPTGWVCEYYWIDNEFKKNKNGKKDINKRKAKE
jgi:hypothetical protein